MNDSLPYKLTILENGVKLVLIPMDGVNSVASAVMVGIGSRYETPEINGISHFLEHMVFKGTKKYPTTEDVNTIERQGGLQNAYTDIDITNYHNKVLAEDWELGLDINKELAINPLIEQKHVDRERAVIIEEMKRYEDEPSAKAEETLHMMMYPGTRLGMRIIGNEDSLKSIGSLELKNFHDKWYVPNRTVVVLAGNLKNQNSKITDTVNNWFLKLEGNTTDDIEVVKIDQKEPKVAIITKPDAQQAHFFLGLRTFPRGSTDRFAWSVFNLLMGISFTSRLFKEIREKRGLCYHIRSSSENWKDVGSWSVYAGVATEKVEEAIKAIVEEFYKAVDKGVTQDEVKVAIKRLKTMLAFRTEDPEFMNEFYGRQILFGDPVVTLEKYLEKIEKVTLEDINILLKKYITSKTFNLSLVWNRKDGKDLINLLK